MANWSRRAALVGGAAALARPTWAKSGADAILEEYVGKGLANGVVLVALGGRPEFRRAFGVADRNTGRPIRADDIFRIGSVTKQFTAAAVMSLAEAGRLRLDDPVAQHLAEPVPNWKAVTIRHLLGHTSGIPDFTDLRRTTERRYLEPETLIAELSRLPLQFEPGARFAYDNTGYVILGRVVEEVSGREFGDYLAQRLFSRAGLRRTGFVADPPPAGRAIGYLQRDGQWSPAPWASNVRQSGAGALYSTASDQFAWQEALWAGRVISPASLSAMATEYRQHNGYGLTIWRQAGQRRIEHSGRVAGYTAMVSRFPDKRLTVVVLSSDDGAPADALAHDLASVWLS